MPSAAVDQAERIIASNFNAEELVLDGIGLEQLELILHLLARMPKLRALRLPRNNLTTLPNDLTAIRRVKLLDISQNPISGLSGIMRGLYTLPTLAHLYVDLPFESEEDEIILSLQSLESFNGTSLTSDADGVTALSIDSTSGAAAVGAASPLGSASSPPMGTGPGTRGGFSNPTSWAGKGTSDTRPMGAKGVDVMGGHWTTSDSEQVEQLYAAVNVASGRAASKAEFDEYSRSVVKHLQTLTEAEEDLYHRRGEVLKAKKILFEYCFEEIVRAAGRKDTGVGSALNVVLESYTGLLDSYADLWRAIAVDKEEKMEVMKRDMQSAIHEIESLMKQVDQQGGTTASNAEAEMRRMQEEIGWLRTENDRLQTRLRQSEIGRGGGVRGVSAIEPANTTLGTSMERDLRAVGARRSSAEAAPGRSNAPPTSAKVLTLKQLKDAIEDIYASKSKYDIKCAKSHLPRETMEQHMYTYLNQRYGLKHIILDWATAIIQGIKKYSPDDNDVAVFGRVLRNEIDEEFRFVQRQVRETVHALLRVHVKGERPSKSDTEIDGVVRKKMSGTLLENEWTDIVRYMYNNEDAVSIIMRIRDHLRQMEQPRRRRAVLRGQAPSDDGMSRLTYSDFVSILLDFQLEGHERFLRRFVALFRRQDTDSNGIINEHEFCALLRSMDPSKTEEEVNAVLELIDPYNNQLITFSECVTFLSTELVTMMEQEAHVEELNASGAKS